MRTAGPVAAPDYILSYTTLNTDSRPLPFLLGLYEQMFRIRQFELTAQRLYRAGEMPGFIHLYIGQEAVAVGICAHLRPTDWITSTHRGHGHALAKGVSSKTLLAELYGKATGCCGGRGGSMHLYDRDAGLFGSNGFVAGGLPAAVGVGLSAKVRGTDQIAVAFFGDGAVNHGAFHESINLAAIQKAPVVFVCENNLYATATPLTRATRNQDLFVRGAAYDVPAIAVDGNDVLAVWDGMQEATRRVRQGGGPTLIEAKTYRVVGHHEGDPPAGSYRTQDELNSWKARCPILSFRRCLESLSDNAARALEEVERRVDREVEEAVQFARQSRLPDEATVSAQVLASPVNPAVALRDSKRAAPETCEQSWVEAVCSGVAEEMRANPSLIYFGEGIGERGGSFAHTQGLWKEFGGGRVIDTPISELGFTGAAAGASASGCRAVADLMFVDFLFEAASQIIEQAAKLRYMSNGQLNVPVVIRASIGVVEKGAGPHHSGTYYPIWAHCPGLLVVVPSNPGDAKGLMKTALRAADPVLFLEHKSLFGMKGPVPADECYLPLGKAAVVREGNSLSMVTCGELVQRCLLAADELERAGVDCEVIDLRTIVPLDVETILESVAKTGRVLVVDEAFPMCGIGAEISATIMEEAFDELDGPVGRLHPLPVSHPCSPVLQNAMMVTVEKIVHSARCVMAGTPLRPMRPATGVGKTSVAGRRLDRQVTPKAPAPGGDSRWSGPAGSTPIMLPNQDLTVTEATVRRWLKRPGEWVKAGEPLVEVETAKSVSEIEAPATGLLETILSEEGDVVELPKKQPLGLIRPGIAPAP